MFADGSLHGIRIGALALVVATACSGRVWASPLEQGVDLPLAVGRADHVSLKSTDAAPELDQGATAVGSDAPLGGATGMSGALVINATFDASITGDPNAAAIQAMINGAIATYESSFNDPITVSILFRYATTLPDGSAMPGGALAISNSVTYFVPWSTYITGLTADATTAYDTTANASLPGGALSTNAVPSSADGRAVGLNTPPAMFSNGSIAAGGPYDGIVTLNSSQPFKFTRPPASGMFDALRTTEHEMDEVLGLGSGINAFADLRPQDLFSWSSAGTRNLTSSGSRYFSIDGGPTNIVGFNQDPSGDFGDWLSGPCPQATPYVQNAFSCANQASDVTQTSPEGINLDVIGYDLILSSTTTTTLATTTTTSTSTSGPPTSTTSSTTTTTAAPTTTTATTTTSTSTAGPPTSTTSSTTATTAGPTTTTTLAANHCSTVADGPTFASVICRLEALLARVTAEPALGAFQPKLAHTLTTGRDQAIEARDLCAASNGKKSKTRLKNVGRALIQYVHRLAGLPARRKLDDTLRRGFLAGGSAIEPDVGTLRKDFHCPADAGS